LVFELSFLGFAIWILEFCWCLVFGVSILKSNVNEEGAGGDDAADALRYLIATRPLSKIRMVRLTGL